MHALYARTVAVQVLRERGKNRQAELVTTKFSLLQSSRSHNSIHADYHRERKETSHEKRDAIIKCHLHAFHFPSVVEGTSILALCLVGRLKHRQRFSFDPRFDRIGVALGFFFSLVSRSVYANTYTTGAHTSTYLTTTLLLNDRI